MSSVIWLPEAILDLNQHYEFLLPKNSKAALSAVSAVSKAGNSLSKNPERGPRIVSAPHQRRLRVPWGKDGYNIRYTIEADTVYILAVYHGREEQSQ